MKQAKRYLCFALSLCLLFSLASCTSGSQPGEPAGPEEKPYEPALDPQTTGSVIVVGHSSNFEALESAFNRFAEFYPNVKMSYTYLDDYSNTLAAALTSEEAPDIFFMYPRMITGQAREDLLALAEDLSEDSLNIDLSSIRENLLQRDAEGHLPMVPVYCATYGMMVNEDLFAKEGIAIPETYADLISACDAFREAGYESPVMGYNQGSFFTFPLYYPYFCAQILSEGPESIEEVNSMGAAGGEHLRSTLELLDDFMNHGCADPELSKMMENDYQDVIMRFFEGNVPMMMASSNTVSGTQKRESQSEAFTASPFVYSFRPVPTTEEGGYFLTSVSMGFAVNQKSKNLDLTNEFMRFLVTTEQMNQVAADKRMVTPCKDMSLDSVYAAFGELPEDHVIYQYEIGISGDADSQVQKACWQLSNGLISIEDAVNGFGNLQDK